LGSAFRRGITEEGSKIIKNDNEKRNPSSVYRQHSRGNKENVIEGYGRTLSKEK